MIRTVKIWKGRPPMPTTRIYFDPDPEIRLAEQTPDLIVTRIIMAAVPAKGRCPAYCTVIAEIYDGDPRQKARTRIALDEAISLDPEDFTEEELLKFSIHPKSMDYPTIEGLRRGIVALKDLSLIHI